MSYFIAAGVIGLGIIGYKRRKELMYNALNLYTNIEESINNRNNKKLEEKKITYFYIGEEGITETNNIEELNELQGPIIQKIEINNKIFHNLYENSNSEIINDLSFYEKMSVSSSQILACTFNLTYNDKKLLNEYDISKLIDTFVFGEKTINLNDYFNYLFVNYINKYYNQKINFDKFDDMDNVKTEYIFLDKDVNMHKGENITLSIKNENLTIKIN